MPLTTMAAFTRNLHYCSIAGGWTADAMMEIPRDVTRTTLAVLFIAGLGVGSFWVLRPFLAAIIWATTLVIATWSPLLLLQRRLGNQRWLAVIVMTLGVILVVLVPFWLAIAMIVANTGRIVGWAQMIASFRLPPHPTWLTDIPFIGEQAAQAWDQIAERGLQAIAATVGPYLGRLTQWFIGALGGLGVAILQLLLTLLIVPILYANGEAAAAFILRFAHRLAGQRGTLAAVLAARAIRGVALGVVISSVIESAVGGAALALTRVPFATLLTAVMFMACVTQIGPGLVLIPATIALYWAGQASMGSILLACTLVVIGLDNILRPALIKRGAHQPLLLVLIGVIGGVASFGLVGIFLGPTILAMTYALLQAWMAEDEIVAASDASVVSKNLAPSLGKVDQPGAF